MVIHTLQQSNHDLVRLSELCRTAINISFLYLGFAEEQSVPCLVNHNITWEQLRSCLVIHTLKVSIKDLVWLSTLCRRAIRMIPGCPLLCRWSFMMMFGYPHFEDEQIRIFLGYPKIISKASRIRFGSWFFSDCNYVPILFFFHQNGINAYILIKISAFYCMGRCFLLKNPNKVINISYYWLFSFFLV